MPRRDLNDDDDRPSRRPPRRRDEGDEDRPARSRRRDDDEDDDRPSRRRGGPVRRAKKPEQSQQKVLAAVGSVVAVLLVLGLVGLRIYLRATRDDRRTETTNTQPAPVRPAGPPTGPPTGGPAMPVGPAAPAPAPQDLEITISNLRVERDDFRKLTLVFDYAFISGHPFLDYCAVVTVPGKAPTIADLGRLRNRDTVSVAYTDFLAGGFPKGTSVYLGQRPRGSSAHPKTASNTLTLE